MKNQTRILRALYMLQGIAYNTLDSKAQNFYREIEEKIQALLNCLNNQEKSKRTQKAQRQQSEKTSKSSDRQYFKCDNPGCMNPHWSRPATRGQPPKLCPSCRKNRPAPNREKPRREKNKYSERTQQCRCDNPSCQSPNWSRPMQKGARPKFCPNCRGAGPSAEPKKEQHESTHERKQHLWCENPSCESPKWSRPATKGMPPKFCPKCRESKKKTQESRKEDHGFHQRGERYDHKTDFFRYFLKAKNQRELSAMRRELSRKYHPDFGGDNLTMALINAAHDRAMKVIRA